MVKQAFQACVFFFWVQSFGRITGENAWRNGVYFTYLFQTMFWSFAPWILIFIVAYITNIVNIFRKNSFFETKELITLGGFTLGYISLAISKYQLPHYIFVVYPLISVITARFIVEVLGERLEGILRKTAKILRGGHWFVISALWLLPFLIALFTFPIGEFDFMVFFNPSIIVMVVFFVIFVNFLLIEMIMQVEIF